MMRLMLGQRLFKGVLRIQSHKRFCQSFVESKSDDDKYIYHQMEGTKVVVDSGNSNLDVVDGIGMVEQRQQFDGKVITTVLPSGIYHKKPLALNNIRESDDINPKDFKHWNRYPREMHAFAKGFPGITPECIHGSSYYFEDGFRKVRPYYFLMELVVNRLPKMMSLLDYMTTLLTRLNSDYLRMRIEKGLIQVNFETRAPYSLLREGDLITSLNHYHEAPVLDEPIDIIYEDENLLVVNKPSSYLLYPCSNHRLNSLIYILAKEKGKMNLRPIHRIDKHTSGICMFSKNPATTKNFQHLIRTSNNHKKEYVALVEGYFPDGDVFVNEPLTSFKVSSVAVRRYPAPKESCTVFKRISFEGRLSLVHCTPKTGRTHQIRIHLANIGFPIVGDYLYNPLDSITRYDIDHEKIQEVVDQMVKKNDSKITTNNFLRVSNADWKDSLSARVGQNISDCLFCQLGEKFERQKAKDELSFMGLHSWKYTIDNHIFEAPLPKWAIDSSYLNCVFERRERHLQKCGIIRN